VAQGLFLEMFFTAELVFTILMLAAEVCIARDILLFDNYSRFHQKTKATFVAPVGIGLSLFIAELMGVYFTGGSLNPGRALRHLSLSMLFLVLTGFTVSYENLHDFKKMVLRWFFCLGVGPFLGALLAAGFYKLMKSLNYEEVNGDQDKA
jgi:aquaporin related protein